MPERYDPASFEAKWRQRWKEADLFKTREDPDRPKFYGLEFFPYPSGAGLSVGHCRNYVPSDVICRMKYMQGYNVLHPMGFDAFGLPAENAAIQRRVHPAPMIDEFAATYRRQMDLIGMGYDWSRTFKSSEPAYYKWTQWIFGKLFERGLAYRSLAAVNWDPVEKTVLANEEVIGGRAERSGALVEKKYIPQWFFKITEYAQRLLDDLDDLDWPEGIKAQQRNWIGRSEGVQFAMRVAFDGEPTNGDGFEVVEKALTFEAFTTRIDTVYGVTFCVLAPEHPLLPTILGRVAPENAEATRAYIEAARELSDLARQAEGREKTGVFTGAYAVNPFTHERVPLYVADYVLMGYGTGAIMAVPGHDERDFEFARKFDLPVVPVIQPTEAYLAEHGATLEQYLAEPTRFSPVFQSKDGVLINSGEYTGLSVSEAQNAMADSLEQRGIGVRKVQYKLRDWLISRQRYWGCPIPIVHTKDGEMQLVPDDALPVYLPDVDNYEPTGDGSSPLAHIPEFVNCTDRDGRLGQRETDTMGGFACSSWYFLRFIDPHNDEAGWDPGKAEYWMPVDCYVGGAEHAVMHLLYARFWTKVLYDCGLVSVAEPFARLENQGQVLALTPYRKPREGERLDVGEDGILVSFEEAKALPEDQLVWKWVRMSKSKGNVVTPEEAAEQYGVDALRMFLCFVAPFHADVQWSSEGMQGQVRFLSRICKLVDDLKHAYTPLWRETLAGEPAKGPGLKARRLTHKTIAKAGSDIEQFAFNTYVSSLMIFVNELSDLAKGSGWLEGTVDDEPTRAAISEAIESLVLLLAPGAPHTADEIWESLGRDGFTYQQPWPTHDPAMTVDDTVTIAVQVNGKLRDTLEMPADADQGSLEAAALASTKVQAHMEGKTVRRVIVVPGKLVNVVVG